MFLSSIEINHQHCSELTLRTPGGDSHTKVTGMLVVPFRGVNSGFWSPLGCSGRNSDIFSHQEIIKNHRHIVYNGIF